MASEPPRAKAHPSKGGEYKDVIFAVMIKLRCPSCRGDDVKQANDEKCQLFVCNNKRCAPVRFRIDYVYEAEAAEIVRDDGQVQCPSCDGDRVRKFGKRQGKQIYRCNNNACERTTFRREYAYKACDPRVKSRLIDLKADGKGVRAIGRMLSISKDTVTNTLKKLEGEDFNV
jgi:transposase-like protein